MSDWLEEGKAMPAFRLEDQDGNVHAKKDLLGKPLVLYFYPRDDTPGCTKQACAIRDRYDEILETGANLFGVSGDDHESHQTFRTKFDLPFPLLVDKDNKVATKFGAYREKNMYGKVSMGIVRSTFIANAEGKVVKVFRRVKVDTHDEKVLEVLRELGSEG